MCSYDGGSTLPYTASSNLLMKPPKGDLTTAMRTYKHLLVVMDATMGTGTFKPEKNLEFFRLKSPGTHRWLSW